MNTLLLFFALPIATIILAIVLQKILNSPLLVAATFFAIYLIVTFAALPDSNQEELSTGRSIYNRSSSKCNL